MAGLLESDLLARLREVVGERPVSEQELRALAEQTDGWVRSMRGQLAASERELDRLAADSGTSIADLARELRRVERLYPTLSEAEALRVRLAERARQLRTGWLLERAAAEPPLGQQ